MKQFIIFLIVILLGVSCTTKKKVLFFDGSKALVTDKDNLYSIGDTVTTIYVVNTGTYRISDMTFDDHVSTSCDTVDSKIICVTLMYRNGIVFE